MNAGHITSRSNQWVRALRALGTSRRRRYEERCFVCDGRKLLGEALQSGMRIRYLFLEEGAALPPEWRLDCPVYTAPRDIMEYISTLECTQGVIFCCEMPEIAFPAGEQLILLDHLQDAGNLGTILRTADAFGAAGVVLSGCADPYNPKTVRAAMGSLFRVPIVDAPLCEVIPALSARGIKTYAAVLSDRALAIGAVSLARAAVVIGNEGNGISREVAALCDAHVILPMSGGAESLNASVAAGIVLWEMQRAREG